MYTADQQIQARYVQYPKIEVVELSQNFLSFYLRDCDVSIANALRRVMIGEVPTLAIDIVTISENTTCLQDEIITHRLGLIPIDSTNCENFKYKHLCTCVDSCAECQARYSIDMTVTGNSVYNLTHYDISPIGNAPPIRIFHDGTFQNLINRQCKTEPGILIAKLSPGSSFKAELQAIKGIGSIHTKWSPVGTATFQNVAEITINKDMQRSIPNNLKIELYNKSPRGLFSLIVNISKKIAGIDELSRDNEKLYDLDLVLNDPLCYNFDDDIKQFLKKHKITDFIKIVKKDNEFFFTVECVGQLKAIEVLKQSIDTIRRKISETYESFLDNSATITTLNITKQTSLKLD